MSTTNIVHFVGFTTRLQQDTFVDQWAQYARDFSSPGGSITLQEKTKGTGKFNFLSQHQFGEEDFRFSFMKGRASENFPEQKAKVTMLGGYVPVQVGHRQWRDKSESKLLVLFNHDVALIDNYFATLKVASLNIYEPFYENCMYGKVLEYFCSQSEMETLVTGLQSIKGDEEVCVYRRCKVPTLVSAAH
jgi:hypothetical protein